MVVLNRVPRNETVLREFGPYPSLLTFGSGSTEVQRHARDTGLANVEPITRATLLTLVQLVRDRPVQFFDIGAHVGLHSLLVSTVYPADAVHVTAFEPTPHTAAMCRALAGANQRPIRIERCAISDADGTAELYISPWESSNSLQQGFRPARDVVPVRTVRLDTYCAERGVRPHVVKIDVETYESHVLAGAERTLAEARPAIVCEILPGTDRDCSQRTVDMLTAAGYTCHRFTREDECWLPCAPRDVVDQAPHIGHDWLFTPDPVDDRFRAAFDEWRAAIGACTPDTTLRVNGGGPFTRPELYRPRGQRSR